MERMTALDSSWLMGETANMPMHVVSLCIFDKPEAPVDAVKYLRDRVAAIVDEMPVLHRRLDPTSRKLGNPVWVKDPQIDYAYHLQRKVLPKPGGRDELDAAVVDVQMDLLDRNKPLWQFTVVEGLKGGEFAVVLKLHHAAIDGGTVTTLLDLLFSDDETAAARKPAPKVVADKNPNFAQILMGAYMDMMKAPMKMMAAMPEIAMGGMNMMTGGKSGAMQMPQAPQTLFNAPLTGARSVGLVSIPFADVRAVGKANQSTINDVVLAVCSGALRHYLEGRKALPQKPLIAGLPVSMREEGDTSANNQIAMMMTTMATNVADPKGRLAAIKEAVKVSKAQLEAMRPMMRVITEMPSIGLPVLNDMGALMERLGLAGKTPPMLNLWLSNVPGAKKPYICCGVPAKHNFPLSIAMHGVALNITVTSYVDSMEFAVVACATAVPDGQRLADLIGEEFDSLKAAIAA